MLFWLTYQTSSPPLLDRVVASRSSLSLEQLVFLLLLGEEVIQQCPPICICIFGRNAKEIDSINLHCMKCAIIIQFCQTYWFITSLCSQCITSSQCIPPVFLLSYKLLLSQHHPLASTSWQLCAACPGSPTKGPIRGRFHLFKHTNYSSITRIFIHSLLLVARSLGAAGCSDDILCDGLFDVQVNCKWNEGIDGYSMFN